MKTSEQINEIAAALSKAQGEIRNPEKNKTVEKKGTSKAGKPYDYSFMYADLPSTYDKNREVLAKYNLCHIAATEVFEKYTLLSSRLIHSSGQWFESSLPVPDGGPEDIAGDLTFYRRYLYNGLIGIAGEDDLDDNQRNKTKNHSPVLPKNSISDAQRKRLFVLLGLAGFNEEILKLEMDKRYKKTSTKELTQEEYKDLCVEIEAVIERGKNQQREPGNDDDV
jgi:hypothetical protein